MSESNGMSQNLTLRQQKALAELLHGATVTAAAETAGVRRETVHTWLNQSAFLEAYEAGCEAIRRESQSKLAILSVKAMSVVEKALDDGDLKAALDVLKMTNRGRSEIDLNVSQSDAELDAAIERELEKLLSHRSREAGDGPAGRGNGKAVAG